MTQFEQYNLLETTNSSFLDDNLDLLKSLLSYALHLKSSDIKVSFPTLKNFYVTNNIYKSSWAIYINNDEEKVPKLLYTGNLFIQGGKFSARSSKSPFGMDILSPLTSIANTFSHDASVYKQNWTVDLDLYEDDPNKLKFSIKEYQYFLKLLNILRAQWSLHLCEEINFDFVIIEFSEPSDQLFFIDLESIDSTATKVKTYFKPVSQKSLSIFQQLATKSEFEGKFFNLQPSSFIRDEIICELESFYQGKKLSSRNIAEENEQNFVNNNPFRVEIFKPVG